MWHWEFSSFIWRADATLMFSIRSLHIIATAPAVTHPLPLQRTLTSYMWYGPAPASANFITHDWIRTTWRLSRQIGISCPWIPCVCVCLLCAWLRCLWAPGYGSSLGNLNHLKTLQAYYVWLLYTCESLLLNLRSRPQNWSPSVESPDGRDLPLQGRHIA